ncbi:hypothetical protein L9F63_019605 [Diploptera punctata]|uniref:Uncharacterized protein n=1 Tax=Diploptera punctata TaxID=6984 RepID=A0AAD7ZTY6_DIPPU|nr:hypothetical protein L9F63_019605 [Diploptera punctata]
MSFSKSSLRRFNDTNKSAASANKYTPQTTEKSQSLNRCSSQKIPRFLSSTNQKIAQRSSSNVSFRDTHKCFGRRVSASDKIRSNDKDSSNNGMDKVNQATSRSNLPSFCNILRNNQATSSFVAISPSSQNVHQNKSTIVPSDKQNKRMYEMVFFIKKKRLCSLKKELLDKQKLLLDLYSTLIELRTKVLDSTGKDLGPLEELKLVDLGNLKKLLTNSNLTNSKEIKKQTKSTNGDGDEDLNGNTAEIVEEIDQEFLTNLENKLQELLVDKINENVWLKNIKKDNTNLTDGEHNRQEFDGNLPVNNDESLRKNLAETKNLQQKVIQEFLQDIRNKFNFYISRRKMHENDRNKVEREKMALQNENNDLQQKVKSLNEELENERDKGNNLKDRKSMVDTQLIGARKSLKEMEQKLSSDEIRITQLLSNLKMLEGQLKMKEMWLDRESEELQKVNSATEEQMAKLETKIRNQEERIIELEKELSFKESEGETLVVDLQDKLNDAVLKSEEADKLRLTAESELEAL